MASNTTETSMGFITAAGSRSGGGTISPPSPPPPPPPPAGQISLAWFTDLGGWRVPAGDVGGHSLGFMSGGLGVNGTDLALCGTVFAAGYPHKLSCNGIALGDPLNPGVQFANWPILTNVGQFGSFAFAPGNSGTYQAYRGMAYFPHVGQWWSSTISSYATGGDLGAVALISKEDGTWGPTTGPFGQRQYFGGPGLGLIPASAQAGFGGSTLWFGGGAYHSGQGASAGPSCFVCKNDFSDPVVLVEFGSFTSTVKAERQTRFGDYDNAGLFPSLPQSEGDLGWFQGDEVFGMCMTPYGLIVWSVQGTGELQYHYQTLTGSLNPIVRVGMVPMATLVSVYDGDLDPIDALVPEWFDWPGQAGQWAPKVAGAHWDDAAGDVWLLHHYGWWPGSEGLPILTKHHVEPPA